MRIGISNAVYGYFLYWLWNLSSSHFNASLNIFPEMKGTTSSAISFIRASIMAIFIGLTSYVYDGQATSVAILVFFAVVLIYCLFIVFKIWKNL